MIDVDLGSPEPAFIQIRTQMSAQIQSGVLHVGEKLPPIRALARQLGLSPGTVARAYSALESSGLVETNRRGGTVVAARAEQVGEIIDCAVNLVAALVDHEASLDEGIVALRAAWLARNQTSNR